MLKKLISKIKSDYKELITARKKIKGLETKIQKYEGWLSEEFNRYNADRGWGGLTYSGLGSFLTKKGIDGFWVQKKGSEKYKYIPDIKPSDLKTKKEKIKYFDSAN